jgi:hypothetical protein
MSDICRELRRRASQKLAEPEARGRAARNSIPRLGTKGWQEAAHYRFDIQLLLFAGTGAAHAVTLPK